jgi:hypothetical protein
MVKITIPKTFMGIPVNDETMRKVLERTPINPSVVNLPVNPNAPVASTGDYWEIPNVNYRGNTGNVQILKTLLDNGSSKTQDEWTQYSEQARKAGQFYLPDYPLFFSTLERAYTLKANPTIEEARKKIQEFSRAKWLMTLTRIRYANKGSDKIVHNHGMSDEYEIEEPFVGQDGKIPAGSSETLYQKLLGTQSSVANIDSVFRWLNGTDTYLYRLNSKPKSVDGRVARFGADSYWAVLYCNRDPAVTDAGLGVRFVRAR